MTGFEKKIYKWSVREKQLDTERYIVHVCIL